MFVFLLTLPYTPLLLLALPTLLSYRGSIRQTPRGTPPPNHVLCTVYPHNKHMPFEEPCVLILCFCGSGGVTRTAQEQRVENMCAERNLKSPNRRAARVLLVQISAHGVKQALFLKRARLQKQAHPHSLRTSSQVRSRALPCHCAASALRHASPAHTHTRAFTSPACRAKSCACVSETTVHPIGIRFVLRQAVGDDDHATKQKGSGPHVQRAAH